MTKVVCTVDESFLIEVRNTANNHLECMYGVGSEDKANKEFSLSLRDWGEGHEVYLYKNCDNEWRIQRFGSDGKETTTE